MSLLTDEQKEAIVDILIEQCRNIQKENMMEQNMFPKLYDQNYMSGRRHSITAKVYAGFQEDTEIPGMSVKKVSYGVNMWLPEISNDVAVIQLYNKKAGVITNNKEVKKKCSLYNKCGSHKRYGIIRFELTDENILQLVNLVTLNANAKVIHKEYIYPHVGETIETKLK